MSCAYRVLIDCVGMQRYVDIPRTRGINSFRDGFWVNEDWQFTNSSDAIHWIPPGRIVIATKQDITPKPGANE